MRGDGGAEVPELVKNHPVFQGRALCNVSFVLSMNKGIYDGLPDDLNAVIDRNSGIAFAIFAFLLHCQIAGGHAAVDIFTARLPPRANRVLGAVIVGEVGLNLFVINTMDPETLMNENL